MGVEINESTLEAIAKGYDSIEGIGLALNAVSEALSKNSDTNTHIFDYLKSLTKKAEEDEEEKKREDEEEMMYKKFRMRMKKEDEEEKSLSKQAGGKTKGGGNDDAKTITPDLAPKTLEDEEEIKGSLDKQNKDEKESEKEKDKEKEKYLESKKMTKGNDIKKSFDEQVEEKAQKRAEEILKQQGWKKATGGQRRVPVVERMEKIMKGETTPTTEDMNKMSYGELKELQMKLEQEEIRSRFPG